MSEQIRIRCNRCNWDCDHQAHWECDCHHVWNVFETDGQCPACKSQWLKVKCPACAFPIPLEAWYQLPHGTYLKNLQKGKDHNCKPGFLKVFNAEFSKEPSAQKQIKLNAALWIMDREQYLLKYPEANYAWFNLCQTEPDLIKFIDHGIQQIHQNKGFELLHPIEDLDIPGFNRLMDILMLQQMERVAHFGSSPTGFIIDEFDIKGELNETIKMYNKVIAITHKD